jgi:hypothetical protein
MEVFLTQRAEQADREENTIFNQPTCTEAKGACLALQDPSEKELSPLAKPAYKNKSLQSTSG